MLSIKEQKIKLRLEIKELRARTSNIDYQKKNDCIKKILFSFIEQQNAEIIHCYLSMNDQFEVNTFPVITRLLQLGKTVVVPLMVGNTLEHSQLFSINDLRKNSWGVLEPKITYKIDINRIDLIFVPLLGVDLNGNRLGYGKGHYDKFLISSKALKIGLVFEEFVYDEIPFEQHDIKLDGIISEKEVRFLQP